VDKKLRGKAMMFPSEFGQFKAVSKLMVSGSRDRTLLSQAST
jgi:hypothetical protein